MPALNSEILYMFFDSSNMHRWNDHLCPVELTELDKQAHKAAIAWMLAKYEESEGNGIDWRRLIENTMFSFIQRSVLTDLKPQVYYRMVSEKREQVNSFVISQFDSMVPSCDPGFRDRLITYLESNKDSREDAVIRAAHYLATRWEFNLIYDSNRSIYGIDDTRREIDEQIYQHVDLRGVREIMGKTSNAFDFIDIIGQLRFQQRWARTPRIPRTTVLGHSLMVSNTMYLHDLDAGADDNQVYNDYYTGLFHDLPEVLTKDVITPIKVNVDGLAELLEEYEHDMVESTIMPMLLPEWHDEFRFMVFDPFTDVVHPQYGTRSGSDLKACDLLAAYMEAYISGCYGISSRTLEDGAADIRSKLMVKGKGIGAKGLIEGLERMRL